MGIPYSAHAIILTQAINALKCTALLASYVVLAAHVHVCLSACEGDDCYGMPNTANNVLKNVLNNVQI